MPIDPSNKNHIDALLALEQWGNENDEQRNDGTPRAFTVSFNPQDTRATDQQKARIQSVNSATPAEQEQVGEVLERWSAVAGVAFSDAQEGDQSADIVVAKGDFIEEPGTSSKDQAGGIEFSTTDAGLQIASSAYIDPTFEMKLGNYGYVVAVHELGHSLGLKHPMPKNAGGLPETSGPYLPDDQQNRDFSAMAYDNGQQAIEGNLPVTPMAYDIAAAQYIYGPNLTHNYGETEYTLEPGRKLTQQDSAMGQTVIMGGAMTIWDSTSNIEPTKDTLRVPEGYAGDSLLDTRPSDGNGYLHYSAVGDTRVFNSIPYGRYDPAQDITFRHGEMENATGGKGADRLIGNDLTNMLTGNGGDDVLIGGKGADEMNGGVGYDRYDWTASTGEVDRISDADGNGTVMIGESNPTDGRWLSGAHTSVNGDYVQQADGSLRYDPALDGGSAITNAGNINARLNGSELTVTSKLGTGGGTLIVENAGPNGALGINIIPENCGKSFTGIPTCGADGFDALTDTPVNRDWLSGNDVVTTRNGTDDIQLGSGSDIASTRGGNDTIRGGTGNDKITSGAGSDVAYGDEGDDQLVDGGVLGGEPQADVDAFHGGPGNDQLSASGGKTNLLYGDEGDDRLIVEPGARTSDNRLYGGPGNDIFVLNAPASVVDGGTGADRYEVDVMNLRSSGGTIVITNLPPEAWSTTRQTFDPAQFILKNGVSSYTVDEAKKSGLVSSTPYFGGNLYINIAKTQTFGLNNAGAALDLANCIIVENFYEGWGGIRGIEGAPLPPWEPAPPYSGASQHMVYLALITRGGGQQAHNAEGQGMASVEMRHSVTAAHSERISYTEAPLPAEMVIVAIGLVPRLIYGGSAATGLLPRSITQFVQNALNVIQIEIDVALIRVEQWLKARVDNISARGDEEYTSVLTDRR